MDRTVQKYLFDIQTCINNIDNVEVQIIIVNNLPVLKNEIAALLSETANNE